MAKVDETIQRVLPEVGSELLEHGLDGKLPHARGDGVGLGTVGELVCIETRAVLLEEGIEFWRLHDGHLRHLRHAVRHLPVLLRREENRIKERCAGGT